MARRFPYVTVDVFTDRPFTGNPLAVVTDASGLTPDEMRAIAAEFNYSESTFVLPPEDPATPPASGSSPGRTKSRLRGIPTSGPPS